MLPAALDQSSVVWSLSEKKRTKQHLLDQTIIFRRMHVKQMLNFLSKDAY